MEMTPQEIAGTTFRVVKKGFDPEEVRAFQMEVARALEDAQNQASLMEQRARAAVAKAQGLRAAGATFAPGAEADATQQAVTSSAVASNAVAIRADDAEIISRTLVLAQRTAENTIADATREASEIRAAAEADAHDAVQQAMAVGATLVADVRIEARRAGEAERAKVDNEIQALLARLDFLRGDVQEMEAYADTHRQRLAEAAEALRVVSERPLLGPGDLKVPILSPAADMARVVPAPEPVVERVPVAQPTSAIASSDLTPGVGSPLLPPLEFAFSDLPTGEIPRIRPTSGPVSVPDLDDDPEFDSAPAWVSRPNDLRIVGD